HASIPRLAKTMRLSLVIPTLDEERWLPECLTRALEIADEVCVSDGGSRDATVEIARSLGVPVVNGMLGRGAQLNRGARSTSCEALAFLHADTRLPPNAAELIQQALDGGALGGGFLLRFEPAQGALRHAHRLTTLRTRLSGWPLGDQMQFVRRDVFEALGGFREWPILEDIDFIRRLRRRGQVAIIDQPVTTSARRFERHGVLRTSATNYLIWLLYFAGVPPSKLARLYRNIR
ncbi:MAG: TIGR04283 family arsenosugar biosynthesis glycosyltransferase, partial [Acidobacteriota bacterium]